MELTRESGEFGRTKDYEDAQNRVAYFLRLHLFALRLACFLDRFGVMLLSGLGAY